MYLNNHLPWDCITPVKINVWDNDLETKIAKLKENSAKRIAENANYQAFIRQIELYRTLRDRKIISLNVEERYAEYKREKQISEEAEKLLKEEKNAKDAGDVILNEAICIAKDLYTLSIPNK
jgi:carboxyl-terminal processing protease